MLPPTQAIHNTARILPPSGPLDPCETPRAELSGSDACPPSERGLYEPQQHGNLRAYCVFSHLQSPAARLSAPRCATFRSPHRSDPPDSSDPQHAINPRSAAVLGRSNVTTSDHVASSRAFTLAPPAARPPGARPSGRLTAMVPAAQTLPNTARIPGARPSSAAATWQPPSASRLPARSNSHPQHSVPGARPSGRFTVMVPAAQAIPNTA